MRKTVYVSAALWVVSMLLALPDMIGPHVNESKMVRFCDRFPDDWGEWYEKFRTMFHFVVLFACPLVVITVFYSAIAFTLLRRRSEDPLGAAGDAGVRQLNSRRKVRYQRKHCVTSRLDFSLLPSLSLSSTSV